MVHKHLQNVSLKFQTEIATENYFNSYSKLFFYIGCGILPHFKTIRSLEFIIWDQSQNFPRCLNEELPLFISSLLQNNCCNIKLNVYPIFLIDEFSLPADAILTWLYKTSAGKVLEFVIPLDFGFIKELLRKIKSVNFLII